MSNDGNAVIKHFLIQRSAALERRPTRRYDEFMPDIATAMDTAGWTVTDRSGWQTSRNLRGRDELPGRPVIMNSLHDRFSSASQPAS